MINFEKWYISYRYSQWIFIWFFLTIHTRLHEPNPNPKSRKVKQMLNILTRKILPIPQRSQESSPWTQLYSKWLTDLNVKLKMLLEESKNTSATPCALCATLTQLVVGSFWESPYSCHNYCCWYSTVYLLVKLCVIQYNGNKIKRDNLCTICVFPPKVIKRRWSCGWLGGRSPPLLAPRVSPPSACRQLVPIFLRILIC